MSQPYKMIKSRCGAFTWTVEGVCRGVVLERADNGCRVASHWGGQAGTKSIADALARGRRELKLGDGAFIYAGPADGGWGMTEVSMPRLRAEELRSALAFELRKCTPFPLDSIVWGYRVLPERMPPQEQIRVRLIYVKIGLWRKWIEAASGLGTVDALLPAPMGLDSLLEGVNVLFPGHDAFEYVSTTEGRHVFQSGCQTSAMTLRELLPKMEQEVNLDELAGLPVDEQQSYFHALLLGLYGMGRDAVKDEATLPSLPHEMHAHRFFVCKSIAALLASVIVICLGMGLLKGAQVRAARLRLIEADIQSVEKEIVKLQKDMSGNRKEALKALESEMKRYARTAPELPTVLAEVTRLVQAPAWLAGPLEWTMEAGSDVVPVSFTIREPAGDLKNLAIGTALNRSPYLGDVSESKSSQGRGGFIERKFVLKARLDTPEEAAQLARELEAEKNKPAAEPKAKTDGEKKTAETPAAESAVDVAE